MLAEQTAEIKSELTRRSEALSQETEKFYSRWTALKPKKLEQLEPEEAKEVAAKMREWRANWDEIEAKIKNCEQDCKHFDIGDPKIAKLEEIRRELEEEEKGWKVYEEFQNAFEEFEKEDWLSYRNKLYSFQDLLLKWSDKLKANPNKVK